MTQLEEKNAEQSIEIVAFCIGEQYYCIDIGHVREIRGWTPATTLPHAPDYVRGVVNLRGTVLPVMDLSARFGQGKLTPGPRHVVIIAKQDSKTVGLLVDSVDDILEVPRSALQPTPDLASETTRAFIQGVMAVGDKMLRMIKLENILIDKVEVMP